MKKGATLSFVGGELQLRLSGWEDQDGWATIRFDGDILEPIPHEDRDGRSLCFDIPPSELRALRDFLNRYLTAA